MQMWMRMGMGIQMQGLLVYTSHLGPSTLIRSQ